MWPKSPETTGVGAFVSRQVGFPVKSRRWLGFLHQGHEHDLENWTRIGGSVKCDAPCPEAGAPGHRPFAIQWLYSAGVQYNLGSPAGRRTHVVNALAALAPGKRQGKASHHGHYAADNQPHRVVGRVAGEGARDIGTERMRFVEAEDEKRDAQCENCYACNVIHGFVLLRYLRPNRHPGE
jgi:hypothetical protein